MRQRAPPPPLEVEIARRTAVGSLGEHPRLLLLGQQGGEEKGRRKEWPTVAHRGRQNSNESLALALARGQTLRAAAAEFRYSTAEGFVGQAPRSRPLADAHSRGDMVSRSLGKMKEE